MINSKIIHEVQFLLMTQKAHLSLSIILEL